MQVTLFVTATTKGTTRRQTHKLKTMDVRVDGVTVGVIKQVIHETVLTRSRTGIIGRTTLGMRWQIDNYVDAEGKTQFPRTRFSRFDQRREALHELLFAHLKYQGGDALDRAISGARIVKD